MKFLAQETLSLGRHVLEGVSEDALLLRQHLWAQRMQDPGTERLVDTDALLEGNDVVPVAHGLFLASANQRIYGCLRKTGRTISLRVHLQMQVGDGQVLVKLVFTVHINNLAQDAHRAPHVLCTFWVTLYGDTYDNLSTHLAGKISGVVVFQTTVHQHLVADSHG